MTLRGRIARRVLNRLYDDRRWEWYTWPRLTDLVEQLVHDEYRVEGLGGQRVELITKQVVGYTKHLHLERRVVQIDGQKVTEVRI